MMYFISDVVITKVMAGARKVPVRASTNRKQF